MENLTRHKLTLGKARRPEYGPLWLDLRSHELRVAGSDVAEHLSPQEYQLLWFLVRGQGNVFSEGELVDFLYEDTEADVPICNIVAQKMAILKKKVRKLTKGKVSIKNQQGQGYFIS